MLKTILTLEDFLILIDHQVNTLKEHTAKLPKISLYYEGKFNPQFEHELDLMKFACKRIFDLQKECQSIMEMGEKHETR